MQFRHYVRRFAKIATLRWCHRQCGCQRGRQRYIDELPAPCGHVGSSLEILIDDRRPRRIASKALNSENHVTMNFHRYGPFERFVTAALARCGALIAVAFLAGCATPSVMSLSFSGADSTAQRARHALPDRVAKLLQDAKLPADALGVTVMRQSDGAILLDHGGNVSLQPASTLKVLTSIVALEQLGPTYRARTELRTAAERTGDALRGDIVLRGFGSPDFDWRALQAMLQTIRLAGIREISGDLILDRSYFQPARADLGVPPFDESPEFRYNVIPDALMLNSNLMQLEITSDQTSMRVGLATPLDRVTVVSDMKIVDKPCADWEDFWTLPDVRREPDKDGGRIRVTLKGEFPRSCPVTTQISVLDRVDFADRLFRSLWASLGGSFSGIARDGVSPDRTRLLAEHQSRTLAEFNREILKRSDNPMTRLAFLALGARSKAAVQPARSAATTASLGEQAIRDWLREKKIDSAGLVLENGSGLSRSERIAPTTLAGVLRVAKQSRWAPEFLSAFPIIGVDGAMRRRLADGPAVGLGRIKTGGLRNVVSVAGYMPDANGEPCVVVAILNHDDAKSAVGKPIVDAVLEWVTRIDSRSMKPVN
jgi:serine-type D-Ala-D-Ala carboxypeptidase/endopeptidase (penicillin-binding protein 4)